MAISSSAVTSAESAQQQPTLTNSMSATCTPTSAPQQASAQAGETDETLRLKGAGCCGDVCRCLLCCWLFEVSCTVSFYRACAGWSGRRREEGRTGADPDLRPNRASAAASVELGRLRSSRRESFHQIRTLPRKGMDWITAEAEGATPS
jgi:hypothetical protein